ncbi:MAG: tetratricopeptide repeat protein [Phyllobacteriaceae bacterium]|nr:tetratricopeptide repeat protein [Phyllobacteriaceae bacterium]
MAAKCTLLLLKRFWLAGLLAFGAPAAMAAETPDIAVPGTFTGALLAGRTAEMDDDRIAAVRFYQQALALSVDSQPVRQSLLLALLSAGDIDRAVDMAEELKDAPDIDRIARLVLGVNAIKNRQFKSAREALTLKDPSDLDTLITGLMRAWADQGAGKTDEALAGLKAMAGPDWFVPFKEIHTAFIADAAGRDAEAQKAYDVAFANTNALQTAPDAWLNLLEAYAGFMARKGNNARAFEVLQRAEDIAPGRPMFAALRQSIMDGTVQKPLIANERDGAAEVLFSLAMAINRDGAEPFVERYLRLALALDPENDLTRYELGRLAERLERPEDAVAFFGSVPQASPLHRLAYMQQALALTDLERDDEAKVLLRAMISETPTEMRPYLALASIFSRAKDYRSAATLYDEAIAAVPASNADVWTLHYQRGIAYERLKEWETAEPSFRKALELKPDDADVLNYLGYSLVDMGMKLDEAIGMVRRAVELEPENGYIIDSLGWAYFRIGKIDEAIVELERAVELKPGDAVINDHLGDAYWAAGRKLEARFQWNHALASDPEPEEKLKIRTKIDDALRQERDAKAAHLAAFEAAQKAVPAIVPLPAPVDGAVPEKKADVDPGTSNPGTLGALQPAAPQTVTVLRGQSLWMIAERLYGDGARYRDLLEANPALRGDRHASRRARCCNCPDAFHAASFAITAIAVLPT